MIALNVPVWVSVTVFPVAFAPDRAAPRLARVAARGLAARSPRSASPSATGSRHVRRCSRALRCGRGWRRFSSRACWGRRSSRCLAASRCSAFFIDGSRPVVPLIKAYEELTSPSANLAAIPLFTLTGFLLAEGRSSERLLRALRGALRLGARRHGRCRGDVVRVLHALHGRVGRDDSRARRPAASGAAEGRLPGAVLDRPADRVGVARPALSALRAADPVRHRRAERRDRGPVHRRPAARSADARPPRRARRSTGAAIARAHAAIQHGRDVVVALGGQVGTAASRRRPDGAARRLRDDVGVGGDRGALRVDRAALHPSRSAANA